MIPFKLAFADGANSCAVLSHYSSKRGVLSTTGNALLYHCQ